MYQALGFLFVGLAAAGVVLPLLPTTPLLLVAAACFAKSSERWHQWLLNNRMFGPILRDWEERRCIPLKSKIIAASSIILFGGASVLFAIPVLPGQIVAGAIVLYGLYYVLRIPVCGTG